MRQLKEALALSGIFTAITVLFFWHQLPHLAADLLGPPDDNLQDFWNSWYAATGADYRHFFRTGLLFHPEGAALNYHSFAYPQVALIAVLTKLFGSGHSTLIVLHNITLLASFPLAALGAYYFVRRLTGSALAAAVGAFVFAFNPWHLAQALHHAHVSQIEFIPFFAFSYLKGLDEEKPAWIGAAAVFFALSALSCWYFLFYLAYFVVFHTTYSRLVQKRPLAGWRLKAPALTIAGAVVLLLPLLVPMFRAGAGHELGIGGADLYVADLVAFAVFPPTHLLGSATMWFYERLNAQMVEPVVYFGLVNLALLLWVFTAKSERSRAWVRTSPVLYSICGLAFFYLIAMGDSLHVLTWSTHIPLPNIILNHLPFFSGVRTPARAMVIGYLFLAVGVGYAIARLAERANTPRARAVVLGVAALIFMDYFPAPNSIATTPATCPAVLRPITEDRGTFGVLVTPMSYVDQNYAMFLQTCHGHPTVTAVVSRKLATTLSDRLDTLPSGRLRDVLRAEHVKYVLVDRNTEWQAAAKKEVERRTALSHTQHHQWGFRIKTWRLTLAIEETMPRYVPQQVPQIDTRGLPVVASSPNLEILRTY